ncbi:unnamed protein product [Cyprideis torosa]|uniref:Uncharacterized protein n=1 Tax=Cyprideis torosa TaxID=163714 RepID=A0A7R8W222_9CRUS|nr:unnamed protein product [Cyprideis torosa]CAG0881471.1 unnamed protein product [Cyprideis torosa]
MALFRDSPTDLSLMPTPAWNTNNVTESATSTSQSTAPASIPRLYTSTAWTIPTSTTAASVLNGVKPRSLFTNPSSIYSLRQQQGSIDFSCFPAPEDGASTISFDQLLQGGVAGGYGDLYNEYPLTPDADQAARIALANCLFGGYGDQYTTEEEVTTTDQFPMMYPSPYQYDFSNYLPSIGPAFNPAQLGQEPALTVPPHGVCLENPYLSPEDIVASRGSVFVTKWGTLALEMRHGCMMELTIDQSFRIINASCNIVLVLNTTGTTSGMLHPNGRIHQYDSRVEVKVYDHVNGNHKVTRENNKRILRTSPAVGTASITTPILHATASMGQSPHMFVRRGERRLHTDLASFVARNAGHSAGFDDTGRLKVY